MGSGKRLSSEETAKITAYKDAGLSNRAIALKIKRSPRVINNFLKKKESYGLYKGSGRKSILDERTKRAIISRARVKHQTASQIRADLQLPVTVQRVRQILHDDHNTVWQKRASKPKLTENHRMARMEFAKKYITWDIEMWKKVMFSDEKKFNLDSPDGFQFYWHDMRKSVEICMSRNFGGGTVMIWGGFAYCGKIPLAWITTKMKAQDYLNVLEYSLLEHTTNLMGDDFIFQQDNASIHSAKLVKCWFHDNNINILDWPACSPDLNPIENLWGIVARQVYQNGKQFCTVGELKDRIKAVWMEIEPDTLRNLISSMPDRLFEVIRNNGGHTHY